jgi:hypothetical protein
MSDELSNIPADGDPAVSSNEPVQQPSGGNEGTPPQSAAPASSPTPQPSQAVPQGQAAESPFVGIREAAYQQYGLDLRGMPDDAAALQHLIGRASKAQQAEQYANRYMQHAAQFEQWMGQQQQAQQQKPASWWSPPEYNPAWRGLVSRDPDSGEYKLSPGAPPEILPKLLAYEQYRRDFADKLTSDPVTTLKPFVEDVARQIAQAQVQQHLGSYQDQVYADNYVQQNSGWLHQRDAQNNVVVDPFTRQPLLSAAGQRFKGYVEQLQSYGVTNLKVQEQQARAMVERDLAMAQLAQYQQGGQNQAIKHQFLQNNNLRQPNQSGAIAPGAPANQGLSLGERLSRNFKNAGIDDSAFNAPATAGAAA